MHHSKKSPRNLETASPSADTSISCKRQAQPQRTPNVGTPSPVEIHLTHKTLDVGTPSVAEGQTAHLQLHVKKVKEAYQRSVHERVSQAHTILKLHHEHHLERQRITPIERRLIEAEAPHCWAIVSDLTQRNRIAKHQLRQAVVRDR